jgi:hypothetical protein
MLERIMGSSARFFPVGEFHCLWELPEDSLCACGSPRHQDPFWCGVLADAGVGPAELQELARLDDLFSRTLYVMRRNFDLEAIAAEPDVRRFLDIQFRIYDAIVAKTGRPYVVDSSKFGHRAWLLACDPRVRFLHLYRSPSAVIASWRSRKFDPSLNDNMQRPSVAKAAGEWTKVEYLMRRLARHRKVGWLVYEDFCEAPQASLEAALAQIGVMGPLGIDFHDGFEIEPDANYHSLNGNPDRFDGGNIRIRARAVNWSKYTWPDRAMIQCAGAALSALAPPRR